MTNEPTNSESTQAQLAALGLLRLCLKDEDASLSVKLLTAPDGTVDVMVVSEVVYLATGLLQALAELTEADPEAMLDEQVRNLVGEG